MEELEKKFWKILQWSPNEPIYGEENKQKVAELIQAVKDYFTQLRKKGGETTKQRGREYYQEIGRKGGSKPKKKLLPTPVKKGN